MITKMYDWDFTAGPGEAFTFTLIAPNGDNVVYPNLNGEQAEQLWRIYEAARSGGWDVRWKSVWGCTVQDCDLRG